MKMFVAVHIIIKERKSNEHIGNTRKDVSDATIGDERIIQSALGDRRQNDN